MDVFSKGCGEEKNEPCASDRNMHDNELGQTRTNWKVNKLNICRHKSKLTRRVIIFPKFMRDSALLRIFEVPSNGQQTEWRVREVHGA